MYNRKTGKLLGPWEEEELMFTYKEIAEITDTRINTVRDRLQVARKKLRKLTLNDPVLRTYAEERFDERLT